MQFVYQVYSFYLNEPLHKSLYQKSKEKQILAEPVPTIKSIQSICWTNSLYYFLLSSIIKTYFLFLTINKFQIFGKLGSITLNTTYQVHILLQHHECTRNNKRTSVCRQSQSAVAPPNLGTFHYHSYNSFHLTRILPTYLESHTYKHKNDFHNRDYMEYSNYLFHRTVKPARSKRWRCAFDSLSYKDLVIWTGR